MSRLSDPAEDWVEILKLYGGRCWICGALWEHKDHYVPRALGGADEPDNWRSACTSEALRLKALREGGGAALTRLRRFSSSADGLAEDYAALVEEIVTRLGELEPVKAST